MPATLWDAVVVGAGLSGLVAAWRLQQAGWSVAVFEARDRVGGRAYSPDWSGSPVDLGPSWVWDTESHVHALLDELGIATFPHHGDGLDRFDVPTGVRSVQLPRSAVPERRVVGGVGSLIDAVAAQVTDVQLSTPVDALRHQGPAVTVMAAGVAHHAEHVLVALPPRLLARAIHSHGAHPGSAVWAQVPTWMADVAKVVVRYPRRWWAEAGLSGRVASALGPMVEMHDLSGPDGSPAMLFGFVPREQAHGPLEERVREQLLRVFGPEGWPDDAPPEVRIQRWWTEPDTAAGDGNGDPQWFGHPLLRKPGMGGRLHLISCETSAVSPGHLNGAVERAEAVAGVLIASRR